MSKTTNSQTSPPAVPVGSSSVRRRPTAIAIACGVGVVCIAVVNLWREHFGTMAILLATAQCIATALFVIWIARQERALQRLNAEFEQSKCLAARARLMQHDLLSRLSEAEAVSGRKSRFLAAASHDIRTPANAISLLAELLQRSVSQPSTAIDVPEIASDLKRSAVSLVERVSDVLDLTRFDSAGVDLHETEFSLGDAVQEECRTLLPLARDKHLSLDFRLPPTPLIVRTDRIKLGRVMANLISNAIKFTDSGGVRVRVELPDGDLAPLDGQTAGEFRVSVTDSGPGIAEADQEKIFDEFFQLRARRSDGGSGLGLAICKRLVNAMGGRIIVRSAVGLGSTFTIILPVSVMVTGRTEAC